MTTRYIPPYATSFPEWMRIASGNFNGLAGDLSGLFSASPNYVGDGSNATFVISQGTTTTPSTSQDAAVVVSKTANVSAFNAFATFAFKQSTAVNARATGVYAEATDNVGGAQSFVEGTRSQASLIAGANGSAYGGVFVAGTNSSGVTTPAYLIGVEGEVDNQIGPDAPTFATFNSSSYTASFVATNGLGTGTRYKADAAFVTNPFSLKPYRTGLLFAAGSIDDTGIAYRSGVSIQVGIDMSQATIASAAIKMPNNVPIRAKNGAGTADHNILAYASNNLLDIGLDASGYVVAVAALGNFASDAAAATGGVGVGQLYRNGSALMVRVT